MFIVMHCKVYYTSKAESVDSGMASKTQMDVLVRRLLNQPLEDLVMEVNDHIRGLDELGSETFAFHGIGLSGTLVCPGDDLSIIGGVVHLDDDSSYSGGE